MKKFLLTVLFLSFTMSHELSVRNCDKGENWSKEEVENQLKDISLYARQWLDKNTHKCFGNDIVVMQFNVLAEGLSGDPDVTPPFPAKVKSAFGGFDSVVNPKEVLNYSKRKWKILHEILRTSPDILAAEELDHYYDFFGPVLKEFGYNSTFLPKIGSPCLDFGYYSDGTALFWKTDKLTLDENLSGYFTNEDGSPANRPYALIRLRDQSNYTYNVAAVHLKAKYGQKAEDLRADNIHQLLSKFQNIPDIDKQSTILMGDFNTDPFDIPGHHKATCIPTIKNWPSIKWTSAYTLPESEEEIVYTTWKKRGDLEMRHVIDYIWYSNLNLLSTLSIPSPEVMSDHRLPCLEYPSDHFAIAARFVHPSLAVVVDQ